MHRVSAQAQDKRESAFRRTLAAFLECSARSRLRHVVCTGRGLHAWPRGRHALRALYTRSWGDAPCCRWRGPMGVAGKDPGVWWGRPMKLIASGPDRDQGPGSLAHLAACFSPWVRSFRFRVTKKHPEGTRSARPRIRLHSAGGMMLPHPDVTRHPSRARPVSFPRCWAGAVPRTQPAPTHGTAPSAGQAPGPRPLSTPKRRPRSCAKVNRGQGHLPAERTTSAT